MGENKMTNAGRIAELLGPPTGMTREQWAIEEEKLHRKYREEFRMMHWNMVNVIEAEKRASRAV